MITPNSIVHSLSFRSNEERRGSFFPLFVRLALFALTFLLVSCINDDETIADISIGDKVPAFSVRIDGGGFPDELAGSVYDSRKRDGKGAVIIFFNTECSDCQRELPILDQRYREGQYDDCHVICVSREQDAEAIATYWQSQGFVLPYSAQTDRSIYNLFATREIPRVYTVSPAGIIVDVWV